MFKKVVSNINSRKFKYFMVFLAISSLVWFFGRLSETYQSEIKLKVNYIDVPNHLFSAINNPKTIGVKVRAKGFALMRSQLNKHQMSLSVDGLDSNNGIYHMSTENLINQVKSQLPTHLEFLSVNTTDVSISMFELNSKKVAVKALMDIQLMPNYIVHQMIVEPDSITISGSKEELEKFCSISTEMRTLKKVNEDIDIQLALKLPEDAFNLNLSHQSVDIQLDVERYLDRIYELDIQQINTSDSLLLKTFPSSVKIIAYTLVKDLKEVSSSNFSVYVDAQKAVDNPSELLDLHLKIDHPKVLSAYLLEKKVEYILR